MKIFLQFWMNTVSWHEGWAAPDGLPGPRAFLALLCVAPLIGSESLQHLESQLLPTPETECLFLGQFLLPAFDFISSPQHFKAVLDPLPWTFTRQIGDSILCLAVTAGGGHVYGWTGGTKRSAGYSHLREGKSLRRKSFIVWGDKDVRLFSTYLKIKGHFFCLKKLTSNLEFTISSSAAVSPGTWIITFGYVRKENLIQSTGLECFHFR